MSEHQSTQHVLQNKDTTYTKIFVGGLPYHTTDKSLRKFFETFGEIEEAVVITDRQTGKSRGYGFVTMADREAAERAVKDANPIIDGRKANVNLAYLGAKPRSNNTSNGLGFAVRSGYHPVLPNSQFGLPSNPFAMYATPASSNMFMSGPSILLPPTAHFFADFATFSPTGSTGLPPPPHPVTHLPSGPSAATSLPPHTSFLNHHHSPHPAAYNPYQAGGGFGHPSSSTGHLSASHSPFTATPGAFIAADARMQ